MTKSEEFYERLYQFALNALHFTLTIKKTSANIEYSKQLIRSSSSVGANYIEALEGLSKKDFVHRLRICRKETRESIHWLRLIKDSNNDSETSNKSLILISEADELKRILSRSIMTLEKQSS